MREIVGGWVTVDGAVVADDAQNLIYELVASRLIHVAEWAGGYTTLYNDPADNSYWERTYPNSGMHGGGPQTLTEVLPEDVFPKYGLDISRV